MVLFDGPSDGDWVITLADLAELGGQYLFEHPSGLRTRIDAIEPAQLATLIYTSGTRSTPQEQPVVQGSAVGAFQLGVRGERGRRLHFLGENDLQLMWPPMLPMSLRSRLFDRLVFRKVRQVFGWRIRFFISGAAPLNRDIGEWFHAAGLLILEGYGLTETAAGACINRPDHYKLGTVGLPFDGTSIRIRRRRGNPDPRRLRDGWLSLPARQDG